MSVAPPYEIVITDVHASSIAYLPVDDDYLPVVTVVELRPDGKVCYPGVGERHHLNTRLLHLLVIAGIDGNVGDVLMYEPHFHPFPGLLHQKGADLPAAEVLLEVEILHVDMILGIPYILRQGIKLPLTGCNYLYIIVIAHSYLVNTGKQPGKLPVFLPDLLLDIVSEQQILYPVIRTPVELLQEIPVAALEKACAPPVESEHDIAYQPEHRDKAYDQNPRNLPS